MHQGEGASRSNLPIGFGILSVLCAAYLFWVLPLEIVAVRFVYDDTFYYLGSAWNHARVGFPTFDGEIPTNGFQPMWYLLMRLLAEFAPDKESLLRMALTTGAIIHAASLFWIHRISQTVKSPAYFAIGGALWVAFCLLSNPLRGGMEMSLVGYGFWWFLSKYLAAVTSTEGAIALPPLARAAGFTILARLDSLIPIGVLMLLMVLNPELRRRISGWRLSIGLVFAAFGLFGYLMWCWAGTLTPISALVKLTSDQRDPNPLAVLVQFVRIPVLYSGVPILPVAGMGIAGIVWQRGRLSIRGRLIGFATLAMAAYVSVFLVIRPWAIQPWYFATGFVFLACLVGVGAGVLDRLPRGALGAISIGWLAILLGPGIVRSAQPMKRPSVMATRHRVAFELRDRLPAHAVLASWNAGQLGYWTDRRLVNLDGLVNSPEYSETVLRGYLPLSAYFRLHGVTHLIDYRDPTMDQFTKGLKPLNEWKITDELTLRLFDVSGAGTEWSGGWYRERKARQSPGTPF